MTWSALAAAFAEAPLEADGWDRALRLLAASTGAARGQLIAFEAQGGLRFSHITDIDQPDPAEMVAVGVTDPARSWRVAATGGVLEMIGDPEYERMRPHVRSEAYDEFCDRHDIPFGAQTLLLHDEALKVGLATLRTRRDGRSSSDQLALFASAMPLAQGAVRLQRALDWQGVQLAMGAIEAMSAGAFLLDGGGRVLARSEAALDMVRGGLVRLARDRLAVARPDVDRLQQRAIAAALSGQATIPARLWLPAGDGALPGGFCEVFALPRRDWDLGARAAATVVIRPVLPIEATRAPDLQSVFGLTAAEAAIALHIANGTTREEIARLRGSRPGTVAVQIKAILHKVGARREAELVAFVNRVLRG